MSRWKGTMSTTGWRVGTSVTCNADRLQRCDSLPRALGASPFPLQHERAHGLVDGREVAVQQLLRLVGFRGDVRALAELEHRLLRRRPVTTGARDEPALVVGDGEGRRAERLLNRLGQPGNVLAIERRDRRDRSRVARRVTPALLDRRRADHDLVAGFRKRALGLARQQPCRPSPGLHRLQRERRRAFVAHADEHVRLALGTQDELERLHGVASRLRRVERRAAAGEEQPRVRETAIGWHAAQPLRLGSHRRAR